MNKYSSLACIASIVVSIHQLARLIIFPVVAAHGQLEIAPFFNLVEVWNHGVSFGMMKGLPYGQWLLSGIALTITAGMFYWLQKSEDKISLIAFCLVIAGALGNVLDRIRFGAVADYLDFHAFGYHWPAFNFTDIAIVSGIFLLLFVNVRANLRNADKKMAG
jgi:signal peptidase II